MMTSGGTAKIDHEFPLEFWEKVYAAKDGLVLDVNASNDGSSRLTICNATVGHAAGYAFTVGFTSISQLADDTMTVSFATINRKDPTSGAATIGMAMSQFKYPA